MIAGGERRRERGRSPARVVVVLLVLAGYGVALVLLGGREALDAVTAAAIAPLVGAVVLEAFVTAVWPLVHRASLRAVGADIGYRQALEVSMSAFTVSHTVPGGGAVGAAAAVERLGRFGIPAPTGAAAASLTGLLSLTTIAVLGAVGIVAAFATGDLSRQVLGIALGLVVALTAAAAAIVGTLRSPRIGEWAIEAISRVHRRLRRRASAWRSSWRAVSRQAPGAAALARVIAWSTLKWCADVAALALVFVAFGQTPRLTVLLVGFGAAQALGAVPATPGAVGLVEGGMVAAFTALGVPLGPATTVAITYRVAETWLPALAGVPVLLAPRAGD